MLISALDCWRVWVITVISMMGAGTALERTEVTNGTKAGRNTRILENLDVGQQK